MKGPNSSEPGRLFLPFQFGKSFGNPCHDPVPGVTIALTPVAVAITFDLSAAITIIDRIRDCLPRYRTIAPKHCDT